MSGEGISFGDVNYERALYRASAYNQWLLRDRMQRIPYFERQTQRKHVECSMCYTEATRRHGCREGYIYSYPHRDYRDNKTSSSLFDYDMPLGAVSACHNKIENYVDIDQALLLSDDLDTAGISQYLPSVLLSNQHHLNKFNGILDSPAHADPRNSLLRGGKRRPGRPGRLFPSISSLHVCHYCDATYRTKGGLIYHLKHKHHCHNPSQAILSNTSSVPTTTLTLSSQVTCASPSSSPTRYDIVPMSQKPNPPVSFIDSPSPALSPVEVVIYGDVVNRLGKEQRDLQNGQCEVDAGRYGVDDGWCEVDEGRCEVYEGESEVDKELCEVDEGQGEVDEGRCEIYEGESEVDKGRRDVDEGQGEVDEGRCEVVEGRCEVDEGQYGVDVVEEEGGIVQGAVCEAAPLVQDGVSLENQVSGEEVSQNCYVRICDATSKAVAGENVVCNGYLMMHAKPRCDGNANSVDVCAEKQDDDDDNLKLSVYKDSRRKTKKTCKAESKGRKKKKKKRKGKKKVEEVAVAGVGGRRGACATIDDIMLVQRVLLGEDNSGGGSSDTESYGLVDQDELH